MVKTITEYALNFYYVWLDETDCLFSFLCFEFYLVITISIIAMTTGM